MGFQYDVLVSRNFPLLTKEDQGKIRQTRLLIAGCGATGSVIAELAVRAGFEHFVMVDADGVELKNLNRQSYDFSDVGQNKAEALARRLSRINPQCSVTCITHFLDAENASTLVSMADLIIDGIDALATSAIAALHIEARNQRKPVLSTFNLGCGGGVLVVMPDSAGFDEILAVRFPDTAADVLEADMLDLMRRLTGGVPDYLSQTLDKLRLKDLTRFPQTVTGAYQCGVLAVAAAIRVALGLPTAVARFVSFDPWQAFDVARDKA